MQNLDKIPGINYYHSSFSIEDRNITLRFYNAQYCAKFVENYKDVPVTRKSPCSVRLDFSKPDYEVVQDYLARGVKTNLDPNEELAAKVFIGAFKYAVQVFVNCLMLGGAYETNEADKREIMERLKDIAIILAKYEPKGE